MRLAVMARLLAALALVAGIVLASRWQAGFDGYRQGSRAVDLWASAVDQDFAVDAREAREAGQLVRLHPRDGRIHRVLAESASGPTPGTENWMRLAAHWAARDLPTRARLAAEALEGGRPMEAATHYDAMIRLTPQRADEFFRIIQPQFGQASFRQAWLSRLHRMPPWRGAFSRWLASSDRPLDEKRAFYRALSADDGAEPKEGDDALDALQRGGQEAEAAALWQTQHPDAGSAGEGDLLSTGVMQAGLQHGYGWRFADISGVTANWQGGNAGTPARIELEFSGRAIPDTGVSRRLALPAGREYMFNAAHAGEVGARFRWQLRCQGPGNALLMEAVPGVQGTRTAPVGFMVPEGCSAQQLSLQLRARSLSERKPRGRLEVESLRIESFSR